LLLRVKASHVKTVLDGLTIDVTLSALMVTRAQADDKPPTWALPMNPPNFKLSPDDGVPRHLPDSTASFTVTQRKFRRRDLNPPSMPARRDFCCYSLGN
jgi:hypothetical protein